MNLEKKKKPSKHLQQIKLLHKVSSCNTSSNICSDINNRKGSYEIHVM